MKGLNIIYIQYIFIKIPTQSNSSRGVSKSCFDLHICSIQYICHPRLKKEHELSTCTQGHTTHLNPVMHVGFTFEAQCFLP